MCVRLTRQQLRRALADSIRVFAARISAVVQEKLEQRLGGVVTVAEIIDLTILLRPPANPLDSARQQRLASAVARAAVETEDMMAQRRFQMRRAATYVERSTLIFYGDTIKQLA